jgi:hypothetical protein
MKMLRKVLASIAVAALSSQALAAWTPPITISSAFVEDSDIIVLYTSDASVYTSGCAAGAWMFRVSSTDAKRARVWATVLAAIAAGNKISLWYGDACAPWNYHEFSSIKIIAQ